LVDTPGFNDTDRKDTVILQEVATWLSASYSDKKLLSGIIYLHRITDNRMDGTAIRNLRMFQSLCGEKVLPNVVLTTTHWDIADQRLAVEREAELRNRFWKGMTQRGAKIMRFDGSREAASRVVDPMLSLDRVVLKIQTQIEGGMKLSDTDAGQTVSEELSKAQKRFEKEITDLRKDMKKASDEKDIELAQILEQERKNAQQKLQQVTFEQEQFRRTTSDDLRAQVARLQQESNEKEKKLKNYKRAKAIAAGGILFGYPGMALATWATK